jgi:hypothetical protein
MRVVSDPTTIALDDDLLIEADNADVLPRLPGDSFDLVYIDPPFNTGRRRERRTLAVHAAPDGDRAGFAGRRYRTRVLGALSYADDHADYLEFLGPRLDQARRLLAPHGTLYVHLDYREAHYVKVLLDEIFGRDAFLNELVWAYDYGGRPRGRWPAKHDTILVYVRSPGAHHFDAEAVDREPYMGPRHAREGRARQASVGHLVAHDRRHQREREDRLSDAEAGGHRATDGAGLLAPGRLVPGLLRRLRDAGRGVREAGPALRPRRQQPRGDRRRPEAAGRLT